MDYNPCEHCMESMGCCGCQYDRRTIRTKEAQGAWEQKDYPSKQEITELLGRGYTVWGKENVGCGSLDWCRWDAYADPDYMRVNHEAQLAIVVNL